MTDEYVAIRDKLNERMAKGNFTIKYIAREAELSESTVTRILSGKTPNPTITVVIAIWKAMGGKATELFDETVKVDVVSEAPQVVVPQIDERLYNQVISIYKDSIKTKDKWIAVLFGLVSLLVVFMVAICVIDIFNGGIGYVRY